ncbi:hypothetical protein ACP4OV_023020 [Aristida adscensionis]
MAFLHKLHKCRRNAVAVAANASFLVLVVVFSVFLATWREDDLGDPGAFGGVRAIAAPSSSSSSPTSSLRQDGEPASCRELEALPDDGARCRYLSSRPPCAPRGYVDYLRLYYCGLRRRAPPALGGAALALWLLVLFYLLGDTASEYFCASLEGLSAALRLPPAIAGVTLLSLGNGAPDVLSSVVAFAAAGGGGGAGDDDAGDVGLSSVLGGALFVSTVVAGVVALVAGSRGDAAVIERRGFVRDVCFLLVALCYLLAVLLAGAVTIWAAASFLSLYAAYVLLVWTSHCCAASAAGEPENDDVSKPAASSDLAAPLLLDAGAPPALLPVSSKPTPPPASSRSFCRRAMAALQAPLYLPRRLTIPDIAAHRWSRPHAVASALLAPLLIAGISCPSSPAALLSGAAAGALLAAAAAQCTTPAAPPQSRRARLPWLAGGFLMSVLWSYMVARELVALLVAIGCVAGVRPGVLGATVLAWGNSLGDLVADVAMAMHGGAQTAVSGCYAGPAFNTVVGLGLSLTLAAGAHHPEPYAIPVDAPVYEAVGFLAAALVWALVVLPVRGMRLDKVLGVGLLLIYLCFFCIRLGSLRVLGS